MECIKIVYIICEYYIDNSFAETCFCVCVCWMSWNSFTILLVNGSELSTHKTIYGNATKLCCVIFYSSISLIALRIIVIYSDRHRCIVYICMFSSHFFFSIWRFYLFFNLNHSLFNINSHQSSFGFKVSVCLWFSVCMYVLCIDYLWMKILVGIVWCYRQFCKYNGFSWSTR